jgi:hypothetical protein
MKSAIKKDVWYRICILRGRWKKRNQRYKLNDGYQKVRKNQKKCMGYLFSVCVRVAREGVGVKCEIFGVVYLIADYSFACPTGTWVPRCTLGKHTTKTQKFSRTPSYFCRIGTVTVGVDGYRTLRIIICFNLCSGSITFWATLFAQGTTVPVGTFIYSMLWIRTRKIRKFL